MNTKRVKIRPLLGGTDNQKRSELSNFIFAQLKVKFTKIVPAGDCFAVVCLDESNVDKLITANSIAALRSHQFEVVLPPHLRARKCVVVRGLDLTLHSWTETEIEADLEQRNDWATVEEVIKMKNIPHMIKIRFADIAMACKANDFGLALHETFLSPAQIEPEEFIPLTPCWACYAYDHATTDCPTKETKRCSECAGQGHTFRDCDNKNNPRCLNCSGAHRTLAAICPTRKELLKKKREEKKANKKQFEANNRTYCAVAKLNTELPKVIRQTQPEQTVLQLNNNISLKVLILSVQAHLHNLTKPGSFNNKLNQLLELNGLPTVILPDDAPSCELFKIINNSADYSQQASAFAMEEDSITDSAAIAMQTSQPEPPTAPALSQKSKHQQQQQTQKQHYTLPAPLQDSTRPKEQRPGKKQPPPAPPSTPEKSKQKLYVQDLGITLYAPEDESTQLDNPEQLYRAIKQGKVKYQYSTDRLSDEDFLRYIRDGTLSLETVPLRPVEPTTFKKIRNGLRRSSMGELHQKQKAKTK